jgi:hypothetical protein
MIIEDTLESPVLEPLKWSDNESSVHSILPTHKDTAL